MADNQQSSVRFNARTGDFEVSGSEQFIERIISKAPALFEALPTALPQIETPPKPNVDSSGNLDEASTLTDFIAAKKLTKGSAKDDVTTAFVYYLTKVKKSDSVSNEDIERCYEQAGFPKPANMGVHVNDLRRTNRKGYLASAGRGRSRLTVAGENFVVTNLG